ncbi:hypothetical protein ACRAWF_20925 [Streptomyces sp. L7]
MGSFDWHYTIGLFGDADLAAGGPCCVVELAVSAWVIATAARPARRPRPASPGCVRYGCWPARRVLASSAGLPLLVLLIFVYNSPQLFPDLRPFLSSPFAAGLVAPSCQRRPRTPPRSTAAACSPWARNRVRQRRRSASPTRESNAMWWCAGLPCRPPRTRQRVHQHPQTDLPGQLDLPGRTPAGRPAPLHPELPGPGDPARRCGLLLFCSSPLRPAPRPPRTPPGRAKTPYEGGS